MERYWLEGQGLESYPRAGLDYLCSPVSCKRREIVFALLVEMGLARKQESTEGTKGTCTFSAEGTGVLSYLPHIKLSH